MAIYHLSASNISRGKGQSATAAAAYRSGDTLYSERYGKTNSYKREVQPKSIILKPKNAPDWCLDRETLWNEVERIEKAKNARLAKEINIALPIELTHEEQEELAIEFCEENFVDKGMVSDISIHRDDKDNPHFHVMLTTRPFNEDGTWGNKSKKEYLLDENGEYTYRSNGTKRDRKIDLIDCNSDTALSRWRSSWANITNQYLERNGFDIRISEKSYVDQKINKKPTIHEGYKARQMGDKSDRVNTNKEIKRYNDNLVYLDDYKREIRDVKEVEKLTRNFSSKDKKELANIAKQLKTFVSFDTIKNKEIQLSHWEKSEIFKSKYKRENNDNLSEIGSQKRSLEKANEILKKEANRFIKNNYSEISNEYSLTDFQKEYITDISVKENKILNNEEFADCVHISSQKEFYDSIKHITRDNFKSYLDFSRKLNKYESSLKEIVKEHKIDFKKPSSIEKLNNETLDKLKLYTLRVNNTKKAISYVGEYYDQKISELYPDKADKFKDKMPMQEKEIVVSGAEYFGRPFTYKEINNLKKKFPEKYSYEEKNEVINDMKRYSLLKTLLIEDGKGKEVSDIYKLEQVKRKIANDFPEIFGKHASPAMEQFFYSEISSMSNDAKDTVERFIKGMNNDTDKEETLNDYYDFSDYRKVGNMKSMLSSGFNSINRVINEIDHEEQTKINEMNKFQSNVARKNKRRSGLDR